MLSCTSRACDSDIPPHDRPVSHPHPSFAWQQDLLDLETRLLESFNSKLKELQLLTETKVSHESLKAQLESFASQQQGSLENAWFEQRRGFEELAAKFKSGSEVQARLPERAPTAERQYSSEEDMKQSHQALPEMKKAVNQWKVWIQELSDKFDYHIQKYDDLETKVAMLVSRLCQVPNTRISANATTPKLTNATRGSASSAAADLSQVNGSVASHQPLRTSEKKKNEFLKATDPNHRAMELEPKSKSKGQTDEEVLV